MRIGLFGGSFDPPHTGHLLIAEQAREAARLDHVLWMPAAVPPHKVGASRADDADRLEMCRLATEGNERFSVSDLEISRGGVSYTVDTLAELGRRHPGAELFLVIGGDSLADFDSWRNPDVILGLATLIVYPRPGFDPAGSPVPTGSIILDVPLVDVSSSAVRDRIRAGRSVRYMVSEAVYEYMEDRSLYR